MSGEKWNKFGYSNPNHKQFVTAPERSGLYYFHLHGESGQFFSFPWVVAPPIASSYCNTCCEQVRTLPSCWC